MHHVTRITFALLVLLQPLLVAAQITIEQDSVLSPPARGMQSDSDKSKRASGGSVPPVVEGIIGGALVIGGIVLMISGFKNIDVSRPELDISNWSWTKEQNITWQVDAQGGVKNTGKVPLENVTLFVSYYDSSGQLISQQRTGVFIYPGNSSSLSVDEWATWPLRNQPACCSGMTSEPATTAIRAEYTYDKIYDPKNAALGWIGVASAGVGAYLLYDAIFVGSKLHAALDQRGIDFVLVSNILEGYGGMEVRYGF